MNMMLNEAKQRRRESASYILEDDCHFKVISSCIIKHHISSDRPTIGYFLYDSDLIVIYMSTIYKIAKRNRDDCTVLSDTTIVRVRE